MGIVGFSFKKILAEKMKNPQGEIKLEHNLSFNNVESTNVNFGSDDKGFLKIDYTLLINYREDIGRIEISGEVIYSDTKQICEEVLKEYEANKKIPDQINALILRYCFEKSLVKSLSVADELNLPMPVPLMKMLNFTGESSKKE